MGGKFVQRLTGKQGVGQPQKHGQLRMRIERIWLVRPVWVIAITAGLCLAALWAGRKVYFDYNLIKMQSPSLPSVVYEQTLLDSADKSLLYGVVLCTARAPLVGGADLPLWQAPQNCPSSIWSWVKPTRARGNRTG